MPGLSKNPRVCQKKKPEFPNAWCLPLLRLRFEAVGHPGCSVPPQVVYVLYSSSPYLHFMTLILWLTTAADGTTAQNSRSLGLSNHLPDVSSVTSRPSRRRKCFICTAGLQAPSNPPILWRTDQTYASNMDVGSILRVSTQNAQLRIGSPRRDPPRSPFPVPPPTPYNEEPVHSSSPRGAA